jgi:predicted Fe-Mo cluster-binding NifX family protein
MPRIINDGVAALDSPGSTNTSRVVVTASDNRGLGSWTSARFESCDYHVVADIRDGRLVDISIDRATTSSERLLLKRHRFKGLGANVLITGSINAQTKMMLETVGVEVIDGVHGEVGIALTSFLNRSSLPRSSTSNRARCHPQSNNSNLGLPKQGALAEIP